MNDQGPKNSEKDPMLRPIEDYLSKSSERESQVTYLKQKGIGYYLNQLNSDPEQGLKTAQVKINQTKYGKNIYKKKKTKSFLQIFCSALKDEMLIILMVAAAISVIVEYFFSEDEKEPFWLQGASIMIAVIVVSLVGSVNDYQKQKQFQELNAIEEESNKYKIVRNSERIEINKDQIVVGDILLLEGGMEVPVDGLVIKAEEVIVNEGAITGEATEKYKNRIEDCEERNRTQESPSPVIISGTSITSGNAKVLVLVVGPQSTAGKLNEQIMDDENDEQTPLEIKLDLLVGQIGKLGVISAGFVFLALTVRLFIEEIFDEGWDERHIAQILKYLILAVSIVVVAIPEGLPLAVTMSLAYSVKKMLHENNLVRKLASCETMGGAHVICTDKTGTLTQNVMSVVEIWNGEHVSLSDYAEKFNSNSNRNLLNALIFNSKAELEPKEEGSSTEIALLKFCREISGDFYRDNHKQRDSRIRQRIPFNSSRKRMTTLIEDGGKMIYYQKGGAEIVLEACNKMQNKRGQAIPLQKSQVNKAVEKMASQGYRVIALAFKESKGNQSRTSQNNNEQLESSLRGSNRSNRSKISKSQQKDSNGVLAVQKSDFTLQMLIGIMDLERPETKQAITDCHTAGVVVIMVTGDNKTTARAIADKVGITQPGDNYEGLVREGKQIESISPDDDKKNLESYLKNLKVLARSRPEHKLRLVECLKQLNNVVAVTGDGTNDAPALMKANVGFSMGLNGTMIAKSASDIVIKDDRFDSIVKALIWGRNIYESIRKFLQFQLTVNIVACLMSVISSLIVRQSVLTAIQMLWVNMIMDSLASLALATEPPSGKELLKRRPFEKKQPLITKTMLKHIITQSVFQITILLLLMFYGPLVIPEFADEYDKMIGDNLEAKYYMGQPQGTVTNGLHYKVNGDDQYIQYEKEYGVFSRHLTFIFNTFVMMQVFNFFNCRRIRDQIWVFDNACSNWLYWLIVVGIFVMQIVIVSFLNIFFRLYNFGGLTIAQWMISIGIAMIPSVLSLPIKMIKFETNDEQDNGQNNSRDLFIKYRMPEDEEMENRGSQQGHQRLPGSSG